MNNKYFWISLFCICTGISLLYATPTNNVGLDKVDPTSFSEQEQSLAVSKIGFADPLIPQLFAFDKDNQLFVGISNVNNTVDIITYNGKSLELRDRFVVDVTEKRHDVHFIYRPQSVAIYDGHIVILASHRDSCYLAVLNIGGQELQRFYFAGRATAFSYSPESGEMYIAGDNELGYNIAVLDVSDGFDKVAFDPNLNFHYTKPRKAEQMIENDPYGMGLTVIALIVVFCALVLLFISFKASGLLIMKLNARRALKLANAKGKAEEKIAIVTAKDVSGEEYAVIAAAIYLYKNELHDEENTILTIDKVARTYSPWSSKIYNMNPYFQIKNGK